MKYKLKIQSQEEDIIYFTVAEAIDSKEHIGLINIMLDDIWRLDIAKISSFTQIIIKNIDSGDYYEFFSGQGFSKRTLLLSEESEILLFIKQITGIEVE